MEERLLKIRQIAEINGWREIDHQENIYMISFLREGVRTNIYYSKMTVATAMNHPVRGKTQLYRRGCSLKMVEKILAKPRIHTGRGYYRRKGVRI